MPNRDPH